MLRDNETVKNRCGLKIEDIETKANDTTLSCSEVVTEFGLRSTSFATFYYALLSTSIAHSFLVSLCQERKEFLFLLINDSDH